MNKVFRISLYAINLFILIIGIASLIEFINQDKSFFYGPLIFFIIYIPISIVFFFIIPKIIKKEDDLIAQKSNNNTLSKTSFKFNKSMKSLYFLLILLIIVFLLGLVL